jgi:hypothetical protein
MIEFGLFVGRKVVDGRKVAVGRADDGRFEVEGLLVGSARVGVLDGLSEGVTVEITEGLAEGEVDGRRVGEDDGIEIGTSDGR